MDLEPLKEASHKTYGDIQIDGNANVLLGDQNISNVYQYNVGTVSLSVKSRKRALPNAHVHHSNQSRAAKAGHRTRRALEPTLNIQRGRKRGVQISHESVGATAHDSAAVQAHSIPYEHIKQLLAILYERFRNLPHIPRLPVINVPVQRREAFSLEAPHSVQDDRLTQSTCWSLSPAGRDLLILSAASLSLLLGRNLSVEDVVRLMQVCQHDQLLPLLTFLLGFGLYRYIALSSLSVTPGTQYFLTIEDAYGRSRPIAADVCIDFSVLRRFLQAHYRQTNGTTGEALIRAGQFHLLLGSRRGRSIQAVNSVFVSVKDTKCPACRTILSATGKGEFHCETCQNCYCNYDTFFTPVSARTHRTDVELHTTSEAARFPKVVLDSAATMSVMSIGNVKALGWEAAKIEEYRGDIMNYTTTGLKNVDIRIVANRRLSKNDDIAWPLRWAQQVFSPFSRPFSASQIVCHDRQGFHYVQQDRSSYEVLRLSFQPGLDLCFEYQSTNGHITLRLIFTDFSAGWSARNLSDLDIHQERLSLTIRRRESNSAMTPWIVIDLSSEELLVLFYNTFLALRSQDTSSHTSPQRLIFTDALFEEVTEFGGQINIEGIPHMLFIYHDNISHRIRLESAPMGVGPRWTAMWTAFMVLSGLDIQRYRRVDGAVVVFDATQFWAGRVYNFSNKYKPPVTDDDVLRLEFDEQKDADEFCRVMTELTLSTHSLSAASTH